MATGSRGTTPGGTIAFATLPDLKVLDVATGKVLGTLNHSGASNAVYSGDGRTIAGGSPNGVRVWNATGGDERWTWAGKGADQVAISASGRAIAVSLLDRSVHLLDGETGAVRARFTGSTSTVTAIGFGATDTDVISSDSSSLRLFSWRPPHPVLTAGGTADPVVAAAVTPDHRRLVAADRNAGLRAWDLETGRVLFAPSGTPAAPGNMMIAGLSQATPAGSLMYFSHDGHRVLLARPALIDIGGDRAVMRSTMRAYDTCHRSRGWTVQSGIRRQRNH